MRLRKKYPFERQKALEVCRDYYQAKGYSVTSTIWKIGI